MPARAPIDEAELVRGVLAGEASAREALYRRHVEYLSGMVVRLLRSQQGSEDVVQDTFVLAFERLSTLRDPSALRSWLAAIAVSFVRRRLRKQRLLHALGLDGSEDDAALDRLARDDAPLEARSELAAIDLALRGVAVNQRIAWMLRYVEGESLDDVATACGCSLATVKRWIASTDRVVRAHLEMEGP